MHGEAVCMHCGCAAGSAGIGLLRLGWRCFRFNRTGQRNLVPGMMAMREWQETYVWMKLGSGKHDFTANE